MVDESNQAATTFTIPIIFEEGSSGLSESVDKLALQLTSTGSQLRQISQQLTAMPAQAAQEAASRSSTPWASILGAGAAAGALGGRGSVAARRLTRRARASTPAPEPTPPSSPNRPQSEEFEGETIQELEKRLDPPKTPPADHYGGLDDKDNWAPLPGSHEDKLMGRFIDWVAKHSTATGNQ